MIEQQKMVHEFHTLYGIPVADTPTPLPADRVHLRVGLIREELEELEEALTDADPVATYDAAIDIMYVTLGMLVEMGMDVEPGFAEVHRSNLSKLGPDGKPIISRGEDVDGYPAGKVLKGPDYSPPDLARVLNELGPPSYCPYCYHSHRLVDTCVHPEFQTKRYDKRNATVIREK